MNMRGDPPGFIRVSRQRIVRLLKCLWKSTNDLTQESSKWLYSLACR